MLFLVIFFGQKWRPWHFASFRCVALTAVFLAELIELKRAGAIPGRRVIEIGAHQLSRWKSNRSPARGQIFFRKEWPLPL